VRSDYKHTISDLLSVYLHSTWSLLERKAGFSKHCQDIKRLFTTGILLDVELGGEHTIPRSESMGEMAQMVDLILNRPVTRYAYHNIDL
jgi:hypothetical protein